MAHRPIRAIHEGLRLGDPAACQLEGGSHLCHRERRFGQRKSIFKIHARAIRLALRSVQKVLVLYRKRTGAMLLRNGVYSHAGSLLIQRLEGSLCGIFELWVLNCAKRGESWRAGWWIVIGWLNWPPGPVFPEIYSRTPGNAGTRVTMVLEPVLRS